MEGMSFQSTFQSFSKGLTGNLEPPVKKHLKNVYSALTLAFITASLGGYVHMHSSFLQSGILTSLGALGCLIWLQFTPPDNKNSKLRLGILTTMAFFTGINLGPLLQMAVMVDETLIMQALMGTSIVFACFSLAALYAPSGKYLYLGGILMSTLSTLMWLSLLNLFFGSMLIFQVNLYLGLALMCGFIIYDTQSMVVKARQGDRDYVWHAIMLFIDFVGLFRRILIILTNKEASNKNKKRN